MFRYLPEQASEHAPKVDWIHNVITDLSVFFTVAIVGTMLYFAWKYRKQNGVDHETPQIHGDYGLEILWTVVPTIVVVFIAYYGIIYYRDMRTVPPNAYTINVVGQKWKWDFEYENGKKTYNEFVVPVDRPVRLMLQSRDVLHSFFIPTMRVKNDAIPGMFTYVAFTPVKTGVYQSYCTEYCGDEHYNMLATMRVVSQNEFDKWLEDKGKVYSDPAEYGANLYVEKGCKSCHSIDGKRLVGPSLYKLFGTEKKFTDGTTAIADEEYIRKSIYEPSSQVVESYPDGMQVFLEAPDETNPLGVVVNEDELKALLAFIKSLDGSQPVEVEEEEEVDEDVDLSKLSAAERGEILYTKKLCNTCHSLDGTRLVGPSMKGIYMKEGELTDGSSYVADDAYLKESIIEPNAKVVKDYPAAMLKQEYTDEEVDDLVAYLKTVK